MGISKRNPRGNFNWQNRILTRKAINCGQLTESFDCGAPELQPSLEVYPAATPIYNVCTNPNGTLVFSNTAANQTIDNTFTVYKDGIFLSEGIVSPYIIYFNDASQSGYYEAVVTNRFGCTSDPIGLQVNVYEKPEVSFISTSSTIIPCIDPNPSPPPPILGDGFVEFTITNFNPAYTYGYNFTYDPGVVNYSIIDNNLTTATFTIDKLCNIRYFMNLHVMPQTGSPNQVCSTAFIVDLTT